MPQPWGVLSDDRGRVTLHAVEGGTVAAPQDFADEASATAAGGIAPGRLIRLGADPDCAPPAPILPGGLHLGAMQQASPAVYLSPTARIVIAGALAQRPDWDGIVVLPQGDDTTWVHVSAREIISFQSAGTRRIAAAFGASGAWGDDFNSDALGDTMARPERLATQLSAAARAEDHAAINGHLLGAELAAMKPYWLGQEVRIIGEGAPYRAALRLQGTPAEVVSQSAAWQAGLAALGRAAALSE